MQAIMADRYGPIDALRQREIARPTIGEREVLVRVRAASLHIGDVFAVRGVPFPVRLMTGLRRPRYGVPGFDLAGTVEAVGPKVTRFRSGDAVFGLGVGTAAEYTRADEATLAPLGALDPVTAAALPTSAGAALHGLRDAGRLRAGQRVLINGASGGVGSFAIQIAKSMGAHVTGVASTRNLELVRSLGADAIVDYTTDDITTQGAHYDLVLDNVENHPLRAMRRLLTPTGTLVLNSGTGATGLAMLRRLLAPVVLSPFVGHALRRYFSSPKAADLELLRTWTEEGRIRPVVDRTWSLSEAPDALRHIASGHSRGKVVVTVD